MSKKRHPNECPTCEQIPCKCVGGGSAEKEKSEEGKQADMDMHNNSFVNSKINNPTDLISTYITDLDKSKQPTQLNQNYLFAHCRFFAGRAKHPAPALSNNLHDEESASNSENPSLGMGMKMGALGE